MEEPTTTLQVRRTTKRILDSLKVKEKMKSYDDVVRHLAEKHAKVPSLDQMFGILKDKPIKFTREDKLKLHEL